MMATGLFGNRFPIANAEGKVPAKVEKMEFDAFLQLMTRGNCNCLMVFMAAWCRPCKEGLPVLNRLYNRFRGSGVQFIGISVDSGGPAAIEKVINKAGVDFPIHWVGEKAVGELNLVGIPMIFLIKNGEIVEKIPGKCSYKYLEQRLLNFSKP